MRKSLLFTALMFVCLIGFQTLSAQPSFSYFFVFLNTNPDKPQISEEEKENLQALHRANLDNLQSDGILHAAGPFDGGGGMLVVSAQSVEEATEIISKDPAVAANRFNVEVLPFQAVGNNICDVKEPHEMVTYQFVRLTSNVEYFGDTHQMVYEDRFFMAEQNTENDYVMIYGRFSDHNDGIRRNKG